MTFKIGLIQTDLPFGEIEANLKKLEALIRQAAGQGAKIICLPESCNIGYQNSRLEEMVRRAETKDGETLSRMSAAARKLHVFLIVPLFLKDSDGICRNTAVLISDTGEVLGSYAKSHVTPEELNMFAAGAQYPVFDTKYGRIGMLICNDLCYPEPARLLGLQAADIVFWPAAWRYFDKWSNQWPVWLSSRALDNQMVIAAVNRIGNSDGVPFSGETRVVGTDGRVKAAVNFPQEAILLCDVSLEEIRADKAEYYSLIENRRPQDYTLLCETNVTKLIT